MTEQQNTDISRDEAAVNGRHGPAEGRTQQTTRPVTRAMVQWEHGELDVKDDNTWLWMQYGAERAMIDASTSWQDALSQLGQLGWELVQIHQHRDWTAYWMKRQSSP